MRARDPAEPYPYVTTDDDAIDAARMSAEESLSALPVLGSDGQPYAERLAGLTAAGSAPRRLYLPPVVGPDACPMDAP